MPSTSFGSSLLLALAGSPHAQRLPKEKGPAHTVEMFAFFCLSQLPDLEGVKKAAGFGEFAQITGTELEQYRPPCRPTSSTPGASTITAPSTCSPRRGRSPTPSSRRPSPPSPSRRASPARCSFPPMSPRRRCSRRSLRCWVAAPTSSWDEGPMRVRAWSGQNDKLLSHVHYYAPAKGGPHGHLSATTYVKD